MSLKTPDLTPAQLLAGALTVVGTGIGLHPRVAESRGRAATAGSALLGAALVGADASIRRARAEHLAPLVLDVEPAEEVELGPEDVPPEDELIDDYGPGEPEELAVLGSAELPEEGQPMEVGEPDVEGAPEVEGEG